MADIAKRIMHYFTDHFIQKRPLVAVAIFVVCGVWLLYYSLPLKRFTDEVLIYDAIWLDAWSLGFVLTLAIIWVYGASRRSKAWFGIVALSIYGLVEIALILHGTDFSMNSYWGDQKFRIAMILKFMDIGWPSDFYYHGLPIFYPPLLYLNLAWLGNLIGVPAYAMMKIGGMAVYLLGPLCSFWLWRRLVEPVAAWLIVLFSFLIASFPVPYPLAAPHAFVATVIFIPWWLSWIEGVRGPKLTWASWLVGSILGAVIATTYFYPFILGAFVLSLRLLWSRRTRQFQLRRAVSVLFGSLLFSAWYWLPVVISLAGTGIDRSRGGWHHIGSTGIELMFMMISLKGLLFLAGILYAVRRIRVPLFQSLLLLLGSIVPFLMIGSAMGALDNPINLVKARDMVAIFAGPFIGLVAAACLRKRTMAQGKWVIPILISLVLIAFTHQINRFAESKYVRTARTAYVPDWDTDPEEMAERTGKVFLSGYEELAAFYPVYFYISANELYSHPAGLMKSRYDLLDHLEWFGDRYLLHLALCTNKYDPVDYVIGRPNGTAYEFAVSLSNYPDRLTTRLFRFERSLFEDSSLFLPQQGDDLYMVMEFDGVAGRGDELWSDMGKDSLAVVMRLAMLRDHLSSKGQTALDAYTGIDLARWQQLLEPTESVDFGDCLRVKEIRMIPDSDSVHFLFAMEATELMHRRYTAAFHLSGTEFHNYDFVPNPPTNSWKDWHTVVCHKSVIRTDSEFLIFLEFFDRLGKLEGSWKVYHDL